MLRLGEALRMWFLQSQTPSARERAGFLPELPDTALQKHSHHSLHRSNVGAFSYNDGFATPDGSRYWLLPRPLYLVPIRSKRSHTGSLEGHHDASPKHVDTNSAASECCLLQNPEQDLLIGLNLSRRFQKNQVRYAVR